MEDLSRHPDDATLFDLFEGTLEPAREQQVRAHLQRCAACAAFVAAARAGAPETTTAVVQMPEPAAERMHLRLRDGWRERTAQIGAAEAREDAVAPPLPTPQLGGFDEDLVPPRVEPPRPAPARRPWSRRLVPVLAFGVLAALAGTSIWIGDDASKQGASGGSAESTADPTTAPADGDIASVPDIAAESATAPSAGDPAAGAAAGAPVPSASDDLSAGGDADISVTAPPAAPDASTRSEERDGRTEPLVDEQPIAGEVITPPAGAEQFGDGTICVLTFDPTAIALPDGRIPQQVLQGPFGSFLVCG